MLVMHEAQLCDFIYHFQSSPGALEQNINLLSLAFASPELREGTLWEPGIITTMMTVIMFPDISATCGTSHNAPGLMLCRVKHTLPPLSDWTLPLIFTTVCKLESVYVHMLLSS